MAQPSQPNAIILAIKGLTLNPSTFGSGATTGGLVQPGSLTIADNVVLDRPSVIATRRGFDNTYATVGHGVLSMFQYNNVKFISTQDYQLYSDPLNNGTLHNYTGTFYPPNYQITNTGTRIRSIETNKNLYFLTDDGTYRLDAVLNTPRRAGVPPGLGGSGVVGATGVVWMTNNTNIAYRVVFGYRDANKQLVLGAPSSRIIVSNSSGATKNVVLTFQYPKEVQATPADFIFQIYRGGLTANLTTEPDDEMNQVYEEACNVPTISGTGSVTITDIVPLALSNGAALYTNQSQDGILQSNYRPPFAMDVTTFKQYAFYANTRTAQDALLTLIASGVGNGTGALQLGDTITFSENSPGIRTFTMTADTANNPATGHFLLQDSGGSNPALDIQVTATNICLVANAMAANLFLAGNYISQFQEIPGQMDFNALTFSLTTFNITSSRSTCWEQVLPVQSSNDARANRIYYSKFNQPEAVPIVNYIEVGSANQPINRILPIRNGVLVMKQDGVFFISNAAPPFNITPIDLNVRILAPNTAVELDNFIYFLSDQGIVAVNDSAAGIKSWILDKTILQNTSPTLYPNLVETAWGLAYQSDRKYILAMPTTGSDTEATQQYVYNHLTDLWVRWTIPTTCGLILKADGKMYLGTGNGSAPGSNQSYIYRERKTYTNQDYVDNQYNVTNNTAGSTTTIVINNPTLPTGVVLLPGWTVTQNGLNVVARIVSVTVGMSTTTLVLDKIQTWATGTVTIWTPVYSEIETIQIDAQNPGLNKQFSEVIYVFTEQNFTNVTSAITCDTSATPAIDIITPNNPGGWGISAWGPTPWGGGPIGQGKVRRFIAQSVQRCGWLYVNVKNAEAFTSFGLSGFEFYFKPTSTRQK